MKKSNKQQDSNNENSLAKWFEDAYEAHFERLLRYAFSITKDKQLAEDVVSDVFMNIWNKRSEHKNIRELGAYLYVSVKRLALKQVTSAPNSLNCSVLDGTLQLSDTIDPEKLFLGKELDHCIQQVLDALPPHAQLVYEMARNEGKQYKEIAEELGISKRTVETHMHSILKKLKSELRTRFKDSESIYYFLIQLGTLVMLYKVFMYVI
ncbi:RNA polymerase sigma-70 factor [Limibacter armeniacum]|uniref:RNA polymerase sigma factor n=1 Tax=Limibacter armeniacum TaxID=466084 RepID=UPI002FE69803